ncbi:hypothetical protein ACFFX0_26405 [Citricoccus parietis]|uniref:Uncharacterized protein n=1 Tax=Citricoccus parietis TaxID=592307 RepID=A0ABV5G6G2_9MICC
MGQQGPGALRPHSTHRKRRSSHDLIRRHRCRNHRCRGRPGADPTVPRRPRHRV